MNARYGQVFLYNAGIFNNTNFSAFTSISISFVRMKVNNETKVGALTAIAITLFILGFNFLRGKSTFKTGNYLMAVYQNTKGIVVSNPVFINGFQVGTVSEIENADADLKNIIVTIKLNDDFNIPKNSIASIKTTPLGNVSIDIALGSQSTFLHSGDTLQTSNTPGLMDNIAGKIDPIAAQLTATLVALEKTLNNVNTTLDVATKANLQQSMANINQATASLAASTKALQIMLNEQNGSITQSMKYIHSFTKNLADNNSKVNNMMGNIEKTTDRLAKTDIDGTVASLKQSVEQLNSLLEKANNPKGTVGMLLNDKAMYANINSTLKSVNTLTDDLRLHPKRYIHFSVFGKKDKSAPLMQPMITDSAKLK